LRRHRGPDASVDGEGVGLLSTMGKRILSQEHQIIETSSGSRMYDDKRRKAESLYQGLIANLKEFFFHFELNNPDFGTQQSKKHGCQRLKVCRDVSCHAESTSRLRSQYLPEADV